MFFSFVLAPWILGVNILIPLGALFGAYCFVTAYRGTLTEKRSFSPISFLQKAFLGAFYLADVTPVSKEKNPLFMDQDSAGIVRQLKPRDAFTINNGSFHVKPKRSDD